MCDVLLSTRETASLLHLKERTVRKLIDDKAFPSAHMPYKASMRVGYRIKSSDVEAFAAGKGSVALLEEVQARIASLKDAAGLACNC